MQCQAYVNVSKELIKRGRVEEAVEVLSKVIAAQPHLDEARAMLGRCVGTLNEESQQRRSRARQRAVGAAVASGGLMADGLLAARGALAVVMNRAAAFAGQCTCCSRRLAS